MPYRLSTLAEQDLEEIWSYVADDPHRDNFRDGSAIQAASVYVNPIDNIGYRV